jgi:hypothetical protein
VKTRRATGVLLEAVTEKKKGSRHRKQIKIEEETCQVTGKLPLFLMSAYMRAQHASSFKIQNALQQTILSLQGCPKRKGQLRARTCQRHVAGSCCLGGQGRLPRLIGLTCSHCHLLLLLLLRLLQRSVSLQMCGCVRI